MRPELYLEPSPVRADGTFQPASLPASIEPNGFHGPDRGSAARMPLAALNSPLSGGLAKQNSSAVPEHVLSPTTPTDADIYHPTGVMPEEIFTAIGRLRKEAQDEIDRLLQFLDATEGDADFEPSLGFPELTPWHLQPSDAGVVDDREEDADFEEDQTDSDAAMAPRVDQTHSQKADGQFRAEQLVRRLRTRKLEQTRARKAAQPRKTRRTRK